MKTLIAPSILAADFGNLQRDVEMINKSKADWFHIDIMDGVFVPNISFGMPVLKSISNHATKPLDIHLMIVDPDRYIKNFIELKAAVITVHYEACKNLKNTLRTIRSNNVKTGVAINPETSINVIEELLDEIDLVCIMSVNPGFGGQTFIENTYNKVKELNEVIKFKKHSTLIEIDGGVTNTNAVKLIKLGADVLVAGSFVFKSENPLNTIRDLKQV